MLVIWCFTERQLEEFVRKAEQDYEAKKRDEQMRATQAQSSVHVPDINQRYIISSFTSTMVEQEVFKDIITRMPKTMHSKT